MKKTKHSIKKISIFYFLLLLIITSVIILIYINNIIKVNQLSISNNTLREEIKKNIEFNDLLIADAEKLRSFDRINLIASGKYNLSYRDNSVDENNKIILKKSELK